MMAQALPPPERDFRGPGCTESCQIVKAIVPGIFGRSELMLHDPYAHEEYGRSNILPGGQRFVWTGTLVIDMAERTASVHGQPVPLTALEWRVLSMLAGRFGWCVPSEELLLAIWGRSARYDWHLLRVHVSRLRSKLGECGRLIETRVGLGYRLRVDPPIEAES
jgi:DNA-binding winged helix-turn-helix (wHTH) protein